MTLSLMTNLLTLFCLAALAAIAIHLRRRVATSDAQIARLEDVLTRLTREELGAGARLSRVERSLKDTRARQDTLASRASAGPRIESAVRVARQGSASEDMLRELGLSAAEASLLLRLHATEEAAGTQDDKQNDGGDTPATVDDASLHERKDSQAATLARLLGEQSTASARCDTLDEPEVSEGADAAAAMPEDAATPAAVASV